MSVHDADYKKVKKLLGVPEEEPIFVIRGQDEDAMATLARYRNFREGHIDEPVSDEWMAEMDAVQAEFAAFREAHGTKRAD